MQELQDMPTWLNNTDVSAKSSIIDIKFPRDDYFFCTGMVRRIDAHLSSYAQNTRSRVGWAFDPRSGGMQVTLYPSGNAYEYMHEASLQFPMCTFTQTTNSMQNMTVYRPSTQINESDAA